MRYPNYFLTISFLVVNEHDEWAVWFSILAGDIVDDAL